MHREFYPSKNMHHLTKNIDYRKLRSIDNDCQTYSEVMILTDFSLHLT
eukprot:UN19424